MTQQSDHSSRHAGFELLRILSMMMIVLMHGIGHGGLGTTAAPGTFPYFIYWLLFMLGRVSTNCFVMLTGYFMWQSKTKVSRLFRIEMQVLFYSLLTFVIGLFAGSVLSICRHSAAGCFSDHLLCILVLLLLFHIVSCDPAVK